MLTFCTFFHALEDFLYGSHNMECFSTQLPVELESDIGTQFESLSWTHINKILAKLRQDLSPAELPTGVFLYH